MKLRTFFISLLALVTVVSCQNERENLGIPSISFGLQSLTFDPEGGDAEIIVTISRDWTATTDAEWLGLGRVSGTASNSPQKISITALPNAEYDRTATITFVVGKKLITKAYAVHQNGPLGEAPIQGKYYEYDLKTDGMGLYTIENVNKPDALTEIWVYDSRYGMKATAYDGSTNYASESWLISPEITVAQSQTNYVSFTHAGQYFGTIANEATLWIREASAQDWEQLTIPNYPNSWTFINSGDIDISKYSGKTVKLGFKYLSTASRAGTWEVGTITVSTAKQGEEPGPDSSSDPGSASGDGSLQNPFNIAAAVNAVSGLTWTSSTDYEKVGPYYVKGVVSSVGEFNSQFGNVTFDLTDAGGTNKLTVYRALYLGNQRWTENDGVLSVGDEVVIYAELMNFHGNTPETVQGSSYVYSINGQGGTPADSSSDPVVPVTGTVVYGNNFDATVATQTYGNGSSWPYLDQFDGWQNQTGSGADGVEYEFASVSARANSASNGNYSDYSGSGGNNLFFGSGTPHFQVRKIALGGATSFALSFGTEKYTQASSLFSKDEFKVYVSDTADGASWVSLDFGFAKGSMPDGRWDIATATFTVPSGTEYLNIYIASSVASAYRLDDLTLTAVEPAAGSQSVNFSQGVDLGTEPINGQGGNPSQDPDPSTDPSNDPSTDPTPVEGQVTLSVDQDYLAAHPNNGDLGGMVVYSCDTEYGNIVPTELRVYKNKTLTFSSNCKIVKVEMVHTANNGSNYGNNEQNEVKVDSGAAYTLSAPTDSNESSITIPNGSTYVSLTATQGQIRITKLTVTYLAY